MLVHDCPALATVDHAIVRIKVCEWPPNRYPDVITITKDSRKRRDTASILADYRNRVRAAAHHSISDRSLGTYSSGWNKFLGFCTKLNIDATNPPVPYTELAQAFFVYMLEDANPVLTPDVANQYITHLLYALKYFQLVGQEATIRTDLTHRMHQAYHRDFKEHLSERNSCTIPMTFPLLTECIAEAQAMYRGLLHLAVPAALASAFACSFRPGEYLQQSRLVQPGRLSRGSIPRVATQPLPRRDHNHQG
jgi:hypothetical protein